jgi:pilus assembly protein CpaC
LLVSSPAAAAEAATPPAASAPAAASEVSVGVGKSQVVELPSTYSDVMVADPKIADVLPLTTHSLYIVGKSLGTTGLTVYGPGKRLISAVTVDVSVDIDSLKRRIIEVLPEERNVSVRPSNKSIILSGSVKSPASAQQVVALAETFAPGKVVNMLSVEGVQQVMLTVRFVEMKRSVAKELQLNVESIGSKPSFLIATGDTINGNAGLLNNLFGGGSARLSRGRGALNVVFDALENKGVVKTLAEPTLVALSGETASFLAGGEFPIPVQQSSGTNGVPTITIEFKQYGVSLAFTPTILKDGLINLVVNPEVSDIDTNPSDSFNLGTISVPGLTVRRSHTTVELRDGESFTIAGLLRDDYTNQVRQMPWVGDVPVLGSLFRSSAFQRDETELVILVTPHLVSPRKGRLATPTDNFLPPSDFELFLFGSTQSDGIGLSAADRALLTADPSKGGVDGRHGHVLY